MKQWYLLYTNPRKEFLVFNQLEDRGIDAFLPHVQIKRGYGRGIRLEPFFPHYLFCRTDLASAEAADLRVLPGMRNIVSVDQRPITVPDPVIQDLRNRLEQVHQRTLSRAEWLFKPGQKVTVSEGPFKGYEAIYQKQLSGGQRVQILLNLVDSWARADMNANQIRPVTLH